MIRDNNGLLEMYLMHSIYCICILSFLFWCNTRLPAQISYGASADFSANSGTYASKEQELGTDDLLAVSSINGIIENYDGNQNDYLSIYRKLIVGRYYAYDKYLYDFTIDGSFNGFFDANNQEVSGYLYEIIEVDNTPVLRIINNEKSAYVDYNLKLTKNKIIVLSFDGTDVEFALIRN